MPKLIRKGRRITGEPPFLPDNRSETKATCSISSLDTYSLPSIQGDVQSIHLEEIPARQIPDENSSAPVEFRIRRSGECLLDLYHTYLSMTIQILREDGSELDDSDVVAPINLPLWSLWREIEVHGNSDMMTFHQVQMAWKIYLFCLLYYSSDAKRYLLGTAGWARDDGAFDTLHLDQGNEGFDARAALVSNSKLCPLYGRLPLDFSSPKVLPTDIDLSIKLYRNSPDFFLMSATKRRYMIRIDRASLFITRLRLTSSARIRKESELSRQAYRYPFHQHQPTILMATKGRLRLDEMIFTGPVPERIYIAQMSQASWSGDYTLNPLMAAHNNLSLAYIDVDGERYPKTPLQPQFGQVGGDWSRSYWTTHQGIGFANENIGFDRSEMAQGYCILVIPIGATGGESPECAYVNPQRIGTTTLSLAWSEPLKEDTLVVAIGAFYRVMEINNNRAVKII